MPVIPTLVTATLLVLSTATAASAYVGPGAGITMIGALVGVIIAIVGALGALLFWPIRALVRSRRAQRAAVEGGGAGRDPSTTPPD